MSRRRRPAKLTAPSAERVVARPRLFARLDAAARAVWVQGPPGAGKTALLASWLKARSGAAGWYSVDSSDADLAGFFFRLRELAALDSPRRRATLPLWSPAHRGGERAFARHFAEAFFARVPETYALVLDDLDALPADAALRSVLPDLIAATPAGCRLLMASRDPSPPALARALAVGDLIRIDGAALELRPDEFEEVARHRAAPSSTPQLEMLRERTRGWAAGLVMWLESGGAGAREGEAPQALFDYLAREVFDQLAAADRQALLPLSLPPSVGSDQANEVAGTPDGEKLLSRLAARQFFTESLAGTAFRFHPLFRSFLQARAREQLGAAELAAARCRAAHVLERAGELEPAAELFAEADAFGELRRLAVEHAQGLLASGRAETLEQWLDRLPAALVDEAPWVGFWIGAARQALGRKGARDVWQRAWSGFEANGDDAGAGITLAQILGSFWVDFEAYEGIERWIGALDGFLAREPTLPPSVGAALAVHACQALAFAWPDHARADALRRQVDAIARHAPEPEIAFGAANVLAHDEIWLGHLDRARELLDLARARAGSGAQRVVVDALEGIWAWHAGRGAEARRLIDRALARARGEGLATFETRLLCQRVFAALCDRDVAGARLALEEVESRQEEMTELDRTQVALLRSCVDFEAGELRRALSASERAHSRLAVIGYPFSRALLALQSATIARALGESGLAEERLREGHAIAERMGSLGLVAQVELLRADALDDGPAAEAALRAAFSRLRESGLRYFAGWQAPLVARQCVRALRAGIETATVRELVRACELVPDQPPRAVPGWPWPVEIRCFGGLAVRRAGRPLTSPRKAQRRPLELLAYLVAAPQRSAPVEAVCDALWPDATGDAARGAFTATLHRLRRLLDCEGALAHDAGRVALDPRRVQVDLDLLDEALANPDAVTRFEAAQALYAGPFLEGLEAPFALAAREQQGARLLGAARQAGAALEATERLEDAVRCYERGLEIDPLAEDLWRRLAVGYAGLGRRAEALAAFERCRRALQRLLGVEPSAQTLEVERSLRAR